MVPEGWTSAKLADLCSKPISYGIVQTGEKGVGSIPCVRVVDLTQPKISRDDMVTTTSEISRSYKKTILESEEIMLALRGEIGLVRLVPEELVGCNLTRGIARISAKKSAIDPNYLLRQIQSQSFRRDLLRRVNGSALQEIPLGELRNVRVAIAPLAEQKKIAEILSTWDRAIEVAEAQLANARKQKRALMQSLLTGKRRFPEFEGQEWREVRLGDVLEISYGKSPKDIIVEDGEWPVVGTGGITGRTNTAIAQGPAIVVGRKGTIDQPQWVEGKFWSIDTTYFCLPKDDVDLRWFFAWLSYVNLKKYNEASGVPSLSRETLRAIPLRIPGNAEQSRISEVFAKCDKEIVSLYSATKKLRAEKKALMQQLLTGRRRVTV